MIKILICDIRHAPNDSIYVGRAMFDGRVGSPLQNPHRVKRKSDRGKAADAYARDFPALIASNRAAQKEMDRLVSVAVETGRLTLGCWCAPRRCHAEVIACEVARRLNTMGHETIIDVAGRNLELPLM